MKSHVNKVTTAAIMVGLAGCGGTTPPPSVQMGPNAEITADGLHRVDHSVMQNAWVKPGLDLSGYSKLIIDEVQVAYQKEPRATRQNPGGTEDNFALNPSEMANLKRWFNEAVVAALTKDDGWEIVDTEGPDVLRIGTFLIDLVVRTPTQDMARQRTFTRSHGEVTVVFELQDAESYEFLARVAERRDPTGNPNNISMVTSAAVRGEVQAMFAYWANVLREGLDALREAPLP
jgi:hypothetical protein